MLRAATPEAIDRLVRAVDAVDRELDTALVCLGVLPPLDLVPIRTVLSVAGTSVRATANRDGHRVLEIVSGHELWARIMPDGTVVEYRRSADMAHA